MFETTSDISIKDNQSERAHFNTEQFSLPHIENKPASRGEAKEFSKKQKVEFPKIRGLGEHQTEIIKANHGKDQKKKYSVQDAELKNKNAFALEVEEKLKLVLGGMPEENPDEIAEGSYDSQDFDFSEKVNQNKEMIKQHKLKKQNQKKVNSSSNKNPPRVPHKGAKPRNQSLYERRVKQYKQQSIENKYLQKKKDNAREKEVNPFVRESLKQIKSKDYLSIKGDVNEKNSVKKKAHPRALSQKSSQKNILAINRSVNLFDGIQNFLQNPHEMRKDSQKQEMIGLSLLKAKRDIEDKIKAINQKLGINSEHENDQNKSPDRSNKEVIKMQAISSEWRKIEINDKKIDCTESNFDKEIERISSLQERSSLSLEKYLEHQKILLDLELRKRN